ncbi:MAG: hypothetical protein ABUS79_11325 [Pseudomonadota bacterium]
MLLLGLGCASPSTLGGTGGDNGNPGAGGSPGNGGSNPGAGGSRTGGTTGNGGTPGAGGAHTGGSTGAGPACTPNDTQLVNANAYFCSSASVGLQGSIYPYGDGMSCAYSPTTPPAKDFCAGGKCCLMGTTKVDTTFAAWGCGIGVEMDDDCTTKHVYNGPASCYQITLTGSSGGNVVRIAFTQSPTPASGAVSPYTEIPAFTNGWSGMVCFSDVTCPGWATAAQCAKTGTNGTPVDLQIQVSAGSTATTVGAYNVCLTSVVPMVSGGGGGGSGGGGTNSCTQPSGSGSLSDQFGTAHVGCPKDYMVQNNDWGVSSASQTITYGPGTKFKVTKQGGSGANGAPASYPDVFIGAHSNLSTTGSGLPLAVSSITATGVQTSWTYNDAGVSGSYNAAYDVWFSTGAGGDPSSPTPSGGYLMVWYYKPSDNQPVGATIPNGTVTINGKQFNIWYGTNNGKPVVSYVAQQKINSWTFPLGAFIKDAVGRTCSGSTTCLGSSWYLTNVFAGFEIWNGGVGLQTTDFGVNVP